jgi:hypothetical protein
MRNAVFKLFQNLSSVKTYELVTSCTPFEAWMDDKQLILQFQVVIGGVPEKWIQEALKINGISIRYNP